jgi:hypothetical protein
VLGVRPFERRQDLAGLRPICTTSIVSRSVIATGA